MRVFKGVWMQILRLLIVELFFLFSNLGFGEIVHKGVSEGQSFQVEELVKGLDIPWGMDFLDADRILFTEKEGKLKVLSLKDKSVAEIFGVPEVTYRGQGGLLDVRKDPKSNWIYLTYSKRVDQSIVTHLGRGKIKGNALTEWKVLLQTKVNSSRGVHFGSRIAFIDDYVFFGMGDRGDRPTAQSLKNHGGTLMRLHKDGRVPKDNPFVNQKGALPEIWSYGHRNPQGLVYDGERKVLWEMEHGPRGGDEINLVRKGANYGWPKQGYGKEYWGPIRVGEDKVKGTIQPIKVYDPSIAPCGLEVYSGKVFKKWKGDLFAGALKSKHLNRIVIKNKKAHKEERLLGEMGRRVRSVREGPDGFLYFSTDNGKILRIRP